MKTTTLIYFLFRNTILSQAEQWHTPQTPNITLHIIYILEIKEYNHEEKVDPITSGVELPTTEFTYQKAALTKTPENTEKKLKSEV